MGKKTITTWQGACIVTGYGVGGTVMTLPGLAKDIGFFWAAVILAAGYALSLLIALYLADATIKGRIKTGENMQALKLFETFLFRGKLKTPLTLTYFVFLALIAVSNLAAYVAGGGQLFAALLPIDSFAVNCIIFYFFAAVVVMLGLKGVAMSEQLMVILMLAIMGLLSALSLGRCGNPLPMAVTGGGAALLRYFGYIMLALAAFFAVPQVVEGLDGDVKEIKRALGLGFALNSLMIIVITFFTLTVAPGELSEMAIIDWTAGLPDWTALIGVIFIIVALLTSFWSISFGFAQIVQQQFKFPYMVCWAIATLPSLLFTLFTSSSFRDMLGLAGGLIGILNSLLFIPMYLNSKKDVPETIMGSFEALPWVIFITFINLLYAIGCII